MSITPLKNAEHQMRVTRLEQLASKMDSQFRLFGVSFGWDAVLGLIPSVGAAATAVPGAIVIAEGARLGARKRVLARMALNTGLDMTIGALPLLGDAYDVLFKSHQRNVALLKIELMRQEIEAEAKGATTQTPIRGV